MDQRVEEALKVLGLTAGCDRATVASAYRRLARATHPDVSDSADAAERFASASAAYRVVSEAAHVMPPPQTRPRDPAPPAERPSAPPSDEGTVYLLGGWPSSWSALSGHRPLVMAGPVMVRTAHTATKEGARRARPYDA